MQSPLWGRDIRDRTRITSGRNTSIRDYLRCMRYLISRQWSVLQDFDITSEPGDLRYQVRGNFGLTQSLTITEAAGERTAQITRTPLITHQVIIDGRQVAEVRHQFLGWNNCTIDSASGQFVAQGNFLGWQYTISQGERVVAALSRSASCPPPSRSTRLTGRTTCSCSAWCWRSSRSTGSADGDAERCPGIRSGRAIPTHVTFDVHRLLAENSVDQRMLEILATKAILFDEYVRRSEPAAPDRPIM